MTHVNKVTMFQCSKCKSLYESEEAATTCCELPEMLEEPNIHSLQVLAKSYLQSVVDKKPTKDIEHWCYEAVMEFVYGNDIWVWINARK